MQEKNLLLHFLRVCEQAAISSARTMGQGDRKASAQAAVEAMRGIMKDVPIRGRIVIGEGEHEEAPMLYIGEKIGGENFPAEISATFPEIDIAVDPLEGTNLCASGANNSISVLAASESGGLLQAPDIYMEKIVVGPPCRGAIDIDAPVLDNLKNIAKRLGCAVRDLTVICLDRSRHRQLISDVRAAGARIRLITDGDLSAGISAAVAGTNLHVLMGIGGAPEGVLTAAAMKCLNGEIQARLCFDKDRAGVEKSKIPPPENVRSRLEEFGLNDSKKVYTTEELAPGNKIIFAATGVTDGALLKGIRFFGGGIRTHSLIMTTDPWGIQFIDAMHLEKGTDAIIKF